MATRKASSTAKKTKKAPAASKSTTTTKVTTVKAVDSKPTAAPASAAPVKRGRSLGFSRSVALTTLLAEFVGTFLLTAVYIVTKGEPLYLGFALIAIILTVGTLSGGHFNPLLTVGAWATRKINSMRAVGYLVAQILGAVAALGLLTAFIGGAPHSQASSQAAMLGQQSPELFKVAQLSAGKEWFVLFAELTGGVIFSLAVASAMREKRERLAAAVNVGFGLFLAALIAGVASSYVSSNAVVNPAIAIAAGAVDWGKVNFMAVAAYLLAPLVGGVLGFALSDALRSAMPKDEA
jgi:aquaporin Z